MVRNAITAKRASFARFKAIVSSSHLSPDSRLCRFAVAQTDLDAEVKKAARRLDRDARIQQGLEKAGTLLPTEETTRREPRKVEIMQPKVEEQREETPEEEQARVFAKLKGMSGGERDDEHERRGRPERLDAARRASE